MDKAIVNESLEVFVFSAKDLFREDNITNAESQKTGIETKYPMQLTAKGRGSLLSSLIIEFAMVCVAFVFSKTTPIMVPYTTKKPML